ncbi:MAG: hydrogenase expression/formation protein HypE [Smithellaceae bacterium]
MTKYDKILLEHGNGGMLSNELIANTFLPHFSNSYLECLEDSAVLSIGNQKFCFTTDSYVVSPVFFPGGDIGSLAVHGTVNDLAVCGGKPLYMSAGYILEEGFPFASLTKIVASMADAAGKAGIKIVTGDTKVVSRGAVDGIFINTSGIGIIEYERSLSVKSITPGDVIILNGTIGDHGAAIMKARENLGFEADIVSDSAPLNGLIAEILKASPDIHCMRDATRGGLGAILAEIAQSANIRINISEQDIPVHENVRGICEILGFDPLFLANEGKVVVFCPAADADKVLAMMKLHELGKNSAVIGSVMEKGQGRVVLKTSIGGERIVDLPTGELVPRIC